MKIKIIPIFLLGFVLIAELEALERECVCQQHYELAYERFPDLLIETELITNDARDECDFKCVEKCNKEIRNRIGGDESKITPSGLEKMCNDVYSDRSVFKDGIELLNRWDLKTCTKGEVNLQDEVCCRFCKCEISFLKPYSSEIDLSKQKVLDLTQKVTKKDRAFICSTLDQNFECEESCRREVENVLKFNPITDMTVDNYNPLANRDDSDRICEMLNQRINSPGLDVLVRMETGPRDNRIHKDIQLGNICCDRVCECELVYKNVNRSLNIVEMTVDLKDKLPKRPLSYYCNDELRECVEDCKIAAGIQLKNEEIKEVEKSPLDIRIFSNFVTARKACLIYNKLTNKGEGVDIYLKYSTGEAAKQHYPFSQMLHLGKICCEFYFNIHLFPKNECTEWNINDIPDNLEDD